VGLWRLIREGFRGGAFVRDEVLVELPGESGYVSKDIVDRINGILRTEMHSVLVGDLPAEVEYALTTCWSKDAQLIGRDERIYPWSPQSTHAD
jgi:hypothetical protein